MFNLSNSGFNAQSLGNRTTSGPCASHPKDRFPARHYTVRCFSAGAFFYALKKWFLLAAKNVQILSEPFAAVKLNSDLSATTI